MITILPAGPLGGDAWPIFRVPIPFTAERAENAEEDHEENESSKKSLDHLCVLGDLCGE
jgi:hypothetical protein